ncbi:hypothetical protein EZ456_04100 [Pedobacter psychrodurus]|uniref:Uncharacterized protein n=1 Tax=Pedobacter psychrodurus TaxID=2530456 RepID=A0A4R0PZA6_9SPHI|nr:hypothetical protein [Pedobacter psychrodurus]TCD28580.1 hypothetical protein EZ456_04100 [Pedobacter psychrodurus]
MFRLQKIHATIIPKGMAVRLSIFPCVNGFWILDGEDFAKHETLPDQVINCDDSFIIEAINKEDLKEDCTARIDIYDSSKCPEILIGKLILSITVKWSTFYDWFPESNDYVTQMQDCYHPPATFRIIKATRS